MKKSKVFTIIILLIIFCSFCFLTFSGLISDLENNISYYINPSRNVSSFFKFFTNIGEAAGVITITAIFMVIPIFRKKVGIPLSITVISSWILSTVIKNLVHRSRPLIRLISVGGYSFPSGHAMNNAALYIGILLLVLKICKTRLQKVLLCIICILTPLLIGISRIYFNVHFFSDVICGWCLGALIAIIFSEINIFKLTENSIK